MKLGVLLGAIVAVTMSHAASAQVFPRHQDICDPRSNIVSPIKLAKAFLQNETTWRDLYVNSVEQEGAPQGSPAWRRIFTDKKFCLDNAACLAPDPTSTDKKPPINTVAAEKTLADLRSAFELALIDNTKPGQSYGIGNPSIGVATSGRTIPTRFDVCPTSPGS